jgi:hypothetical protein
MQTSVKSLAIPETSPSCSEIPSGNCCNFPCKTFALNKVKNDCPTDKTMTWIADLGYDKLYFKFDENHLYVTSKNNISCFNQTILNYKNRIKDGTLVSLMQECIVATTPALTTAPPICPYSEIVIPPAPGHGGQVSINGINITLIWAAGVSTYSTVWTSCGITLPKNSVYLGSGAGGATGFIYSIGFSSPVNNITLIIIATGDVHQEGANENFVVTTNGGDAIINMIEGCYTTISGNQILSGAGAPGSINNTGGGGGSFNIFSTNPYTTVTIEGNGGCSGSLLGICNIVAS